MGQSTGIYLFRSVEALFSQLRGLLDAIDDVSYRSSVSVLDGATIGEHVRHLLAFYQCLLQGIGSKCVDYSTRNRDSEIESSSVYARKVLGDIQQLLSAHQHTNVDLTLSLEDGEALPTNMYREWAYNIEHTLHHMALIRVGVGAVFSSYALPKEFGVALSTLRYREGVK